MSWQNGLILGLFSALVHGRKRRTRRQSSKADLIEKRRKNRWAQRAKELSSSPEKNDLRNDRNSQKKKTVSNRKKTNSNKSGLRKRSQNNKQNGRKRNNRKRNGNSSKRRNNRSQGVCTSVRARARNQYCLARAAAARSDSKGTENLTNMVRTNICRQFYSQNNLLTCPITNDQIESLLRNFSCNCFPENFDSEPLTSSTSQKSWHMGKNGRPLNELDQACMRLRDAYTCITFDYENSLFQDPIPNSSNNKELCGRYTAYEFHINSVTKEIVCGPSNDVEYISITNNNAIENSCKLAACQIERKFADEVTTLIGSDPDDFVSQHASEYDVYSDSDICVTRNNNQVAVSECCGSFPNRLPFVPFVKVCCDVGNGIFQALGIGEC